MKRSTRKIVVKSTVATLLSIAASLGLAVTIVPMLGGIVDGNAWLMCVLCPLLIAAPASAYQFWQNQRLRDAHQEIARLHGEVAKAHRELTHAHAELAEKAQRDGMTGMLNRESFFAGLEHAMALTAKGVLLVIDADHFKTINDRHGHPTGDRALLAIAAAITGVTRQDDLCGRIGGEEFAVYLPRADASEAHSVAERIRSAVAMLRVSAEDETPVPLTVSIGGAERLATTGPAQLVSEADRQLYKAKRLGRDKVVLEPQQVSEVA